jgi:hypothetical protein
MDMDVKLAGRAQKVTALIGDQKFPATRLEIKDAYPNCKSSDGSAWFFGNAKRGIEIS